eukprot:Pompholyxophrys_punicea_v1_NODE_678_length_1472_cov_15.741002.p2 type:complete len:150 gc:universal NODE_678_length_1472_cov_15.741002:453-4(-)
MHNQGHPDHPYGNRGTWGVHRHRQIRRGGTTQFNLGQHTESTSRRGKPPQHTRKNPASQSLRPTAPQPRGPDHSCSPRSAPGEMGSRGHGSFQNNHGPSTSDAQPISTNFTPLPHGRMWHQTATKDSSHRLLRLSGSGDPTPGRTPTQT